MNATNTKPVKLSKAAKEALARIQASDQKRVLVFAKKTASGIATATAEELVAAGLCTWGTDGYTNPQTNAYISFRYAVLKA